MDAKAKVEHYLKTDRSLRGGRDLYNQLPGKSKAFQNALSRFRDTPDRLEKLYYELAKCAKISEHNLKILLQKPVVAAKAVAEDVEETSKELTLDDQLIAFNPEDANYQAAKKLAKALKLNPKSQKKPDIYKALVDARSALVKKK